MRADTLAFARAEATIANDSLGGGVVDLVFIDGERVAVLPFIHVQRGYVFQRESSPMVWPAASRVLGTAVLSQLEDAVLPWLEARLLARYSGADDLRTFKGAPERELFDRAAAAGLIGAAPHRDLLPAFAPYVYAARFAQGRSIGIRDERGGNGAAMLRLRAPSVRADLGDDQQNALCSRWFGTEIFGEIQGACEVALSSDGTLAGRDVEIVLNETPPNGKAAIAVAAAVPTDVLVSFDPDDAPVVLTFSVHAKTEMPVRDIALAPSAPPSGGSRGAILLLLRDGYERAADGDVDEALHLAERLRAEGFTVALRSPSSYDPQAHVDLVHAFGVADASLPPILQAIRARGVPVVLTPYVPLNAAEAVWGPQIISAVYQRSADDGSLDEYLELIALRKINNPSEPPPPPAAAALAAADVVLVNTEAEERGLRETYGFAREAVRYVPLPDAVQPPSPIAAAAGLRDFALVHAPMEARSNFRPLSRAAAKLGIPVVSVGEVLQPAEVRGALGMAPDLVSHRPAATAGELESLYRCARVYADVSWAPRGLARVARAAAAGCGLVVSAAGPGPGMFPNAHAADPASLESIAAALEQAWSAKKPPMLPEGPSLLSAAIYAYSQAIAARQPA
jgi:hypothetical protein